LNKNIDKSGFQLYWATLPTTQYINGSGMKYPLGIQTFSKIIENKLLYVDKTAIIYDLLEQGSMYFLSRPRRFGKSLLISTLEALFSGRKALFDGLYIADTPYDFVTYPVIKMEFSKVQVQQPQDLQKYILSVIARYATQYDISLNEQSHEIRFDELVRKLHEKTGKAVVLLIDEYDKPILDNLNEDRLKAIKAAINAFYSVVKSLDEHLQFVFITGVTKFAKVSVSSGMNNLTDISMDKHYAALCGITQQELQSNFAPAIAQLAEVEGSTQTALMAKIKYWYNGYRFHQNAPTLYNPYSLLSLFRAQEFDYYWFTSATPTFLIELIKTNQFDLGSISNFEVDRLFFATIEPERMKPEPVLLQTGYLSIADYSDGWYRLDLPNHEVKYAFNRAIVEEYGQTPSADLRYVRDLCQALTTDDLPRFFKTLKIFFANIPYSITLKQEKYYQSLFYAIFTLIGFEIEAEVQTNQGRIDCVLQTKERIYIIEFIFPTAPGKKAIRSSMAKKLNDSKEAALQQIHDKQYAQKYQNSAKQITLLGVEFDQDTRNIGDFVRQDEPRVV
jgi:hypothetical protein